MFVTDGKNGINKSLETDVVRERTAIIRAFPSL